MKYSLNEIFLLTSESLTLLMRTKSETKKEYIDDRGKDGKQTLLRQMLPEDSRCPGKPGPGQRLWGKKVWSADNSVAHSGHEQLRAMAHKTPTSGTLPVELDGGFPLTYFGLAGPDRVMPDGIRSR